MRMKIISRIQSDLIIQIDIYIFLVDVGNQLFHKWNLDAAQILAGCKSIGDIESEEVTRASELNFALNAQFTQSFICFRI